MSGKPEDNARVRVKAGKPEDKLNVMGKEGILMLKQALGESRES